MADLLNVGCRRQLGSMISTSRSLLRFSCQTSLYSRTMRCIFTHRTSSLNPCYTKPYIHAVSVRSETFLRRAQRSLTVSPTLAVGSQAAADNLPEPGTPEAPPQVPTSLDTVPGTVTPVEEVILGTDGPANGLGGLSSSANEVHTESGTGDLAGPDGAAVADIAATVQPAMDTLGAASTTEVQLFHQNWTALETYLRSAGYFNFSEEEKSESPMSEVGAIKKACIEAGRARPEAIFDLDPALLKRWVSGYVNLRDSGINDSSLGERKAVNAIKRLQGFVGAGEPVGIGEGGSSSFLDVMRVLFSQHMDSKDAQCLKLMKQEFVMDGAAVISLAHTILQQPANMQSKAQYAELEANRAAEHQTILERKQRRAAERGFGNRPRTESSQYAFRPGDWMCESCGTHNFAKNQSCFKCTAARPASARAADGQFAPVQQQRNSWYSGESSTPLFNGEGLQDMPPNFRPGDWLCPSCNAHNFRSKSQCFRCATARPGSASGTGSSYASGAGSSYGSEPGFARDGKPGDWTCQECGGNNFARRTECFKCGAGRTGSSQVVGGERFRQSRSPSGPIPRSGPTVRSGDWRCSECKSHNFARNSACFRCGASAESGSAMTPDSDSGFGEGRSDSGFGGRRPSTGNFERQSRPRFSAPPTEGRDVDW